MSGELAPIAELDHLVVVGDRRDRLHDAAPCGDEDRNLLDADQAVRHLDAELRIGLGVEHDHLEFLAVDAAGLVDLGHGPFGGLDLILAVERLRAGQRHGEAEAKHILRGGGRRGTDAARPERRPRISFQRDDQAHASNAPLVLIAAYAAARSIDFSAASASSVLITSAYFSDMSNRLTACDTWLRS